MDSSSDSNSEGSYPPPLTREERRKEYERDPAKLSEICRSLHRYVICLGQLAYNGERSAGEIEGDMQDLGDQLIHAAKIAPPDSPWHDRLVTIVLETRERGDMMVKKRAEEDPVEFEGAIVPDGVLPWSDLPVLVQEFHDAWTKESMGFTAAERENLAVLTAKLCAVGVCPTELSRCALWLFRETLETERPLTPLPAGEGNSSSDARLSIAELLPACREWFRHNNSKLVMLSLENYNSESTKSGDGIQAAAAPGHFAAEANVTQHGFSIPRWVFWRRRFSALYRSGNDEIAKLARACFHDIIDSGILLGLEVPGESNFSTKCREAVDNAREEIGGCDEDGVCIGMADIEIDMDWAEEVETS
ncbi:hypothetical protein AJ80_08106 [Polytolypa hystricis UAMH7299]|uniref:Uncharacterized protein n=1 Tax=Polytolypa hystricis (strain UAMH7299) TaxID=1447883 RepID=A0A2B7XDK8_POLH7|nr:hypothetical protein AJ80_08106 [Polytolypa hystricis UAMH7299]